MFQLIFCIGVENILYKTMDSNLTPYFELFVLFMFCMFLNPKHFSVMFIHEIELLPNTLFVNLDIVRKLWLGLLWKYPLAVELCQSSIPRVCLILRVT